MNSKRSPGSGRFRRSSCGVAVAAIVLLMGTAAPIFADQVVTTLLTNATTPTTSKTVSAPFSPGYDWLIFQAAYANASAATVLLQSTVDGSNWMTTRTWDAPGAIVTAPTLGGGAYRISVVGLNFVLYVDGTKTFGGSHLNDATFSGLYRLAAPDTYEVKVQSTGTPDTFMWRKGLSTTTYTTGVAMTGSRQYLSDGVYVTWAATTGHTAAESTYWSVPGEQAGTRIFTGSGLNDGVFTGTYTAVVATTFDVQIDATGTPDTFKWRKGTGAYTSGVAITGAAQLLSDGVSVTFNATTGHTLTDVTHLSIPGVSASVALNGLGQIVLY